MVHCLCNPRPHISCVCVQVILVGMAKRSTTQLYECMVPQYAAKLVEIAYYCDHNHMSAIFSTYM